MTSAQALPADFRAVWQSTLVSCIGDGVTFTALPLLAIASSTRPWAAATATVSATVAGLLASLPAGVVADRYPPRFLMVTADLFRMTLMALLAVVAFMGHTSLAIVCVCAAGNALATPVFVSASLRPRDFPVAAGVVAGADRIRVRSNADPR